LMKMPLLADCGRIFSHHFPSAIPNLKQN